MKLKIIVIAFLVLVLNNACKQEEVKELQQQKEKQQPIIVDPEKEPEQVDEIFIQPTTEENFNLKSEYIGAGYDITGEFASPSAVKAQIVYKRNIIGQKNYDELPINSAYNRLVIGEDALSFLKRLGYKDYGLDDYAFGKTITRFNNNKNLVDSKYIFSSYYLAVKSIRLTLLSAPYDLKKILTIEFKLDANRLEPKKMVQKYGTHILSSIYLGDKFELRAKAETTNTDLITASSATVSKYMQKLFGHNLISNSEDVYSMNFNEMIHYKTYGGSINTRFHGTATEDNSLKTKVSNWENDLNKNKIFKDYGLVDFGDNCFVPIYDLVSNSSKRQALKNYIEKYLIENQVQQKTTIKKTPVYKYSKTIGFYDEYFDFQNILNSGLENEGVAFRIIKNKDKYLPLVPIYKFYDNKSHIYSQDPSSRSGNYYFQDVAFYAFKTQIEGTVPVYEHKYNAGGYKYSLNSTEEGFTNERIAFYAYPPIIK